MSNGRVTMQDVADALNISKNTVYLALNRKAGVSPAVRQKVIEAARAMQYQHAGVPMPTRSRCVCVVAPEYLRNDAFYYADIFWAIETEVKRRGMLSINIIISPEQEALPQLPQLPPEVDVVGILIIGVLRDGYVEALYGLGLPMLSVDILYQTVPVGCIASMNHAGGYQMTRYLISRGHRRIGFIGPIYTAQSVYERWCGYRQAMEESALPIDDSYNILGAVGRFELLNTADSFSERFAAISRYPTAWFCAGDRIAIALMNLLDAVGVKTPLQVSVAGYDDIPVAQMVRPQLTTLRVDRKGLGALAVEQLLRAAQDPGVGRMTVCLRGEVIERASVAPPREVESAPD